MAHQARLDLVHKAICAGVFGNVQFKETAYRQLRDDPELSNFTPGGVRSLLREYVLDGNQLNVRTETRVEKLRQDPNDPFWYRAIIPVPEFHRGLFVEVKLLDDDEDEPFVEIVSVHRQQ